MRTLIAVSLLATTAVAAPALAQINPTFTGPRVEATLGYDHTGAGSSVSNNNGRDDQKIDGLLYGGGIGYDIATSDNIVLGADATGLPVLAGPTEAAALGNVLVQARALGADLADLRAMRALVRSTHEPRRYEPRPGADWDAAESRLPTP